MNRQVMLFTIIAMVLAPAIFCGNEAWAGLNTYKKWDGSQYIYPFGCIDRSYSSAYGQVIQIPKSGQTVQMLHKFSFWLANYQASGLMAVRAEVYRWDVSTDKVTGSALYESGPRTISFTDSAFHPISFSPAVPVRSQQTYLLFLSIDKDYGSCSASSLKWGAVGDNTDGPGTFVYQNNGGNVSRWTTASWKTFGLDLAFIASVSP
jgi:hypothetical protein